MNDEDIWTISGILYSKWVEADNNMKAVKAETNDGSPDWEEFHNVRTVNARNAWVEAERLFLAYKAANRESIERTVRKMMGE